MAARARTTARLPDARRAGYTSRGQKFSGAWNFGPQYSDAKPVDWIVEHAAKIWGSSAKWEFDPGEHPHEDQMLKLDWTKASLELGWRPKLQLKDALDLTLDWYRDVSAGKNAREKCLEQIESAEGSISTSMRSGKAHN